MFKSRKHKIWTAWLLTLAMLMSMVQPGFAGIVKAADGDMVFDLVEITDFHGQLLDSTNTKYVGAALSKVVKDIKASNPDRTLILGGGDFYQGTPVSNVLHGVPVQQVMSNLGMEVTALGNHEFDWGIDTIKNETMKDAKYSIVCSNLYDKNTGKRVFEPYKIIEKSGVKIAVIGAITNETPTIVLPANIKDFEFKDDVTEVNAVAKDIRDNKLADVVVLDIHEGGDALNALVGKLSGIDAVFGGHSHSNLDTVLKDSTGKDVPTLNAKATGQGYVDLKMTVSADKKIVGFSDKGTNYKTLTVTTDSVLDPDAKTITDNANKDLKPIFDEVIGTNEKALTKDQKSAPYGESELGNWMADVVKNAAGADVGMVNNGGIRLSPVPAGNITVGTIFYLMPFDNTVCSVTMNGAQLKFLMEQAVQDNGKGVQVSGIKFTYNPTKKSYKPAVLNADGSVKTAEVPGERVTSLVRESDGKPINDTDIIKVAAPDFLATGGDTFTKFLDPTIKATFKDLSIEKGQDYLVRNALMKDVRANHKIAYSLNDRVKSEVPLTEMTIEQARSQKTGGAILTGTVSAVSGKNVFIQDDTAGICIYGSQVTVKKGDKIKVAGALSTYSGLLEVTPYTVTVLSSNNTVTPKEVSINDILDSKDKSNSLEGQLVKLNNVTLKNIDTKGLSMLEDSTGTLGIYTMPAVSGIVAGDKVDVVAAVNRHDDFQLTLNSAEDITKHVVKTNVNVQILATTDLHARMLPYDYATNSSNGGGSLAQVATSIKDLRAKNPNTILMDNGDSIQDNSAALFLDKTKYPVHPMIIGMNKLGYDVWTLGNHEFNYGMDKLKDFIATAKATTLSANVYDKDGTTRVAKNYKIVQRDGVRIGIIGVTTPNITKWDAQNLAGYKVTDPVDEVKAAIAELNGKVDVMIASMHMGEGNEYDAANSGVIDVATACPELSVVLAGHMHVSIAADYVYNGKAFSKVVDAKGNATYKTVDNAGNKADSTKEAYDEAVAKGVLITEPGKFGEQLGKIDLSFQLVDGKYVVSNRATSVISTKTNAVDPDMAQIFAPYDKVAKDDANQVVGKLVDGNLVPNDEVKGIPQSQVQPTAMIDLINKVQMYYGEKLTGKTIDVSSAAAFRGDANIKAGDIKKSDTSLIYKYDNTLYVLEVTGKQLKQYMEWSASYYNQYKDGDLTVSFDPKIPGYNYDMFTGVKYTVDISKPAGQRIGSLTKMDGTVINDDTKLVLTVNNYRSNSQLTTYGPIYNKANGDTLPKLIAKSEDKWGDDGRVRDLIRQYIVDVKKGTIAPECDNNWRMIGNTWDAHQRQTAVNLINRGLIVLPPSEDGKTSNASAVTWTMVQNALSLLPANVSTQILATTDLHARMLPYDYATDSSNGGGSLAQVATSVKELRAKNPNTILIDNGDSIQDNSAALFLDKTKYPVHPMILGMNKLGYDVWTLGNHEFNYGMDKLKDFIASASATTLSANVYDKDGITRVAKNYKIVEKGGVRIGIIGVTTPNITKWDSQNLEGYKVTDPVAEVKAAIAELNGKVDIMIASMHMGEGNEYEVANSGVIDVASACPELSVVLAGHMHVSIAADYVYNGKAFSKVVDAKGNATYSTVDNAGTKADSTKEAYDEAAAKGVLITEPGKFGEQLGKIDLSFQLVDGKYVVSNRATSIIPTKANAVDPEIAELFAPYDKVAKDDARQVVGKLVGGNLAPVDEVRGIPQAQVQPTAMIDLINKVQMYYGEKLTGKTVDVSAAAAFRGDANIKVGDIKKSDTSLIYKYDNTLYVLEVTGKQLKQYMEWSASYYNQYKDGDLTVSFNPKIPGYNYDMFTGVKYTVDVSKPAGQRIGNLTKMDGTVISDDTKLTLSVNNYRSNSQLTTYGPVYNKANGDTLPKLIAKSEDKWGDDGRVRDLIRQYIVDVKKGTITPECDNNWKMIGNNWDATKRAAVVAAVADGKLNVKPSEDGKSQNAISFTWDDIVKLAAPVTSVKLDQASLQLEAGKTIQLKASVLPLYAIDQNITWTSSDESIATVKDGIVTAVKAGKVTITATAGDIKAECTVEVKAVSVPAENNNGNNSGSTTDTTKPVQVVNDTTKVVDAVKTAPEKSTVVVDAKNNAIASKDIFTSIKGKDVNVTFQRDGISWTFNGKDIDPTLIKDIDLSLKTVSADLKTKEAAKVKAIVGKDVAIVPFSFTYDGKLPGKATVKVFIGKEWANTAVYVNRYYADKNTYETIDQATVDADGYMTFTTDHCSDYFVMAKSAAPNLPKTGSPIDMNVVVGMGSIVALLGAALFISGRKKEENEIAA